MTMKYENVKETIFATKEHYLAFRKAWCVYVNSEDAKPFYYDCPWGGGKTKACRLNSAHHLLFNILTEGDLEKSFKPSPTQRKEGFAHALTELRYFARYSSIIMKTRSGEMSKLPREREERYVADINTFLKPFGSCVTLEMLAHLYDEFLSKNCIKVTTEAA